MSLDKNAPDDINFVVGAGANNSRVFFHIFLE